MLWRAGSRKETLTRGRDGVEMMGDWPAVRVLAICLGWIVLAPHMLCSGAWRLECTLGRQAADWPV